MTKPTKAQVQAAERIVSALLLMTEAVRLDPKGLSGPPEWDALIGKVAKLATAFEFDRLIERALERRGESLGFRSGTGELLLLIEGEVSPSRLLLLDDEAFGEQVQMAEKALDET